MTKPNSLDDNIVYLCAQFSHHFNLLIRAAFQRNGIGITPEQLAVLVFLWYRGKATQQEISKGLNRDKTTIARVVKNMIKTRIVSQAVHLEDNRAKMISLTAKGKRIQDEALQVSGNLYTDVLKGIEEGEWVAGIGVLQKLLRNVHDLSSTYN